MLFIFRKLRRSFFQPGKVQTYLAYAAGEIILIVLGILLALQISEWNQFRTDRVEEKQILMRLKAEFQENQKKLAEHEEEINSILGGLVPFLDVIQPDPEPVPDEVIEYGVAALLWNPQFKPNIAVYNSLIASAKMSLIKSEMLNVTLHAWPSALEQYELAASDNRGGGWQSAGYFVLDFFQWKDTGSITGFGIGPSKFSYDQKQLLSQPKLESWVDLKRANTLNVLLEVGSL